MATRKKHKDPPLPKVIPVTPMAAPTGLLYFMAPMPDLEFDFEGELPFPCDDIEEAEHTIRKEIWGTSKPIESRYSKPIDPSKYTTLKITSLPRPSEP